MLQGMTALDVSSDHSHPLGHRLRWSSGVLALFLATGSGFFCSGFCAWIAEGIGTSRGLLIVIADASLIVGFMATLFAFVVWAAARCRRGIEDLPPTLFVIALLALPTGGICWAIFVDAIAWHLRADIVRPAVDMAMMYLILGAGLPVTLGVPFVLSRIRRVRLS